MHCTVLSSLGNENRKIHKTAHKTSKTFLSFLFFGRRILLLICLFTISFFQEELQGVVWEVFYVFFGQFSVNLSDDFSRKKKVLIINWQLFSICWGYHGGCLALFWEVLRGWNIWKTIRKQLYCFESGKLKPDYNPFQMPTTEWRRIKHVMVLPFFVACLSYTRESN